MLQIVLLALVLMLPSCSFVNKLFSSAQLEIASGPSIVLKFHISDEFTVRERENILSGINLWQEATGNRVVAVQSDLPIDGNDAHAVCVNDVLYLSMNFVHATSADEFVVQLDEEQNTFLLGFYLQKILNYPAEIILVTDRLHSDTVQRFVVAHELGHAFNIKHIDDEYSLMYKSHKNNMSVITDRDLLEFCKRHKCDKESVSCNRHK